MNIQRSTHAAPFLLATLLSLCSLYLGYYCEYR